MVSHSGLNLNFSAVKHHFMCLLVICTSSLEKYLSHFPIFVFENFCPLTISNISIITYASYILDTSSEENKNEYEGEIHEIKGNNNSI